MERKKLYIFILYVLFFSTAIAVKTNAFYLNSFEDNIDAYRTSLPNSDSGSQVPLGRVLNMDGYFPDCPFGCATAGECSASGGTCESGYECGGSSTCCCNTGTPCECSNDSDCGVNQCSSSQECSWWYSDTCDGCYCTGDSEWVTDNSCTSLCDESEECSEGSCVPIDGGGVGGDGCLPTELYQTKACDYCDDETQCVGPDFGDGWEDQGCGLDCGTAGTCDADDQCQKRTDSYGCADEYRCTSEFGVNCIVQSFEIYRDWNLISSPIADMDSVTVIKDTCGATGGDFYFYDIGADKWVVDITGIHSLEMGVSYWFHSSRNCNVTIAGTGDVISDDIIIKAGWNQIGSPTDGMTNADTNLKNRCPTCANGICVSMKILWFNPAAQDWREVGSLETGKGYQIQCINPGMHEQSFAYFPFSQLLRFLKIL